MKKRTYLRPGRGQQTVLRQICELIPTHMVAKLSRACGADWHERTLSCWSHVVTMLYAQLAHAISQNDVCDALRLSSGPLSAIRSARPPAKNTLSHANKVRDHALAEQLFWHMSRTSSPPSQVLAGAGAAGGSPTAFAPAFRLWMRR